MYFGFGLTTDLPCGVADCIFDLDKTEAQTFILGVYPNEIDMYRNTLIAVRNTRTLDDFDHRYQELTINPALNLTFFKCKKIMSDYVGINRIVDKSFQSMTVSFDKPLENKGRVKTGYKEIDNFVNKFTLVDLDSQSIYSPYKMPFNTQTDNDLHKLLCAYSGQDIVVGFKIINNNLFEVDGEQIEGFEALSKHDRFGEIMMGYICNSCKHEPLIIVTKDYVLNNTVYNSIPPRDEGDMTVIIGNWTAEINTTRNVTFDAALNVTETDNLASAT